MPTAVTRRAPVLPARLRILDLAVDAVAVLADGRLEREAAVRIDRVRRAGDDRPRQAAIGRERQRRPVRGDRFAGVAADEHPLAGLPLELHDVQHVFVAVRLRRFGET